MASDSGAHADLGLMVWRKSRYSPASPAAAWVQVRPVVVKDGQWVPASESTGAARAEVPYGPWGVSATDAPASDSAGYGTPSPGPPSPSSPEVWRMKDPADIAAT